MCSACASHGHGGAYVVGRKKVVALALLEECKWICPAAVFRFVRVDDLALLSEADVAVAEIMKLEEEARARGRGRARMDLLFMARLRRELIGRLRAMSAERVSSR